MGVLLLGLFKQLELWQSGCPGLSEMAELAAPGVDLAVGAVLRAVLVKSAALLAEALLLGCWVVLLGLLMWFGACRSLLGSS